MTSTDWIILGVICVGLFQGFWLGFLAVLVQTVSLLLAVGVAFWTVPFTGNWLESNLRLPLSYARSLGLVAVFFLAAFLFQLVGTALRRIFASALDANPFNRIAGAIVGAVRQIILTSVFLALIVALPTPPAIKNALSKSKLGAPLLNLAIDVEQATRRVIKLDSLNSIAYRIAENDSVNLTNSLNFNFSDPSPDPTSEAVMLELLNAARRVKGQQPLRGHDGLRDIARAHAKDMLQRGYFSHLSPLGKNAMDRALDQNISALVVGENLAAAPTVSLAQGGLMASEGHRKNILSDDYNYVGIGVMDASFHGKIFVQMFAKIP